MTEAAKPWSLRKHLINLLLVCSALFGAFNLRIVPCPPELHSEIACPYCKGHDDIALIDWVRFQFLRVLHRP